LQQHWIIVLVRGSPAVTAATAGHEEWPAGEDAEDGEDGEDEDAPAHRPKRLKRPDKPNGEHRTEPEQADHPCLAPLFL
jgi:hypothetical protein